MQSLIAYIAYGLLTPEVKKGWFSASQRVPFPKYLGLYQAAFETGVALGYTYRDTLASFAQLFSDAGREGEVLSAAQELAQKLLELKWWQEQFDRAIEMIQDARTQEQAVAQWKLSNEAEKNYLAVFDWLTAHGHTVIWNKEEQCYQTRR